MFDWLVVMATVCLQDLGLIFRALDAKVHIMLVWLIYSLTWAVTYSLQFSFIRGQLPINLWNVITRLALSFFGSECDHGIHPFKLVHLVVTIKANSELSNLAHRSVENTGPLFLVGGIFTTKVKGLFRAHVALVTDWNPGLFLFTGTTFQRKGFPSESLCTALVIPVHYVLLSSVWYTNSIYTLIWSSQQQRSCYNVAFCWISYRTSLNKMLKWNEIE